MVAMTNLVDIGTPNLKDVPVSLRRLASQIEDGITEPAIHAILGETDSSGKLWLSYFIPVSTCPVYSEGICPF